MFLLFWGEGYKEIETKSKRAEFSALGSLGTGGGAKNLDGAMIRVELRCFGMGLWPFRVSGRPESWLGREQHSSGKGIG